MRKIYTVPAGSALTVTAAGSNCFVRQVEDPTIAGAVTTSAVYGPYELPRTFFVDGGGGEVAPLWREVGEFLTSSVLAAGGVAVVSNTGKTVTSLVLTPGDWDVTANLDRSLTGVTATARTASLSFTDNTVAPAGGGSGLGTNGTVGQQATFGTTITGGFTTVIPPARVLLTATTTLYLVCHDVFSAGTMTAFGTLRARRIK